MVLAYRQTITDLYSGARTNLNDLNEVATGDLVDQDLKDIQSSIGDGWKGEPRGAELVLVSAQPIKVSTAMDPSTVFVRACIDASAVTDVSPSGRRSEGSREELDYTVTKTTYLPPPGWAVSRVSSEAKKDERQC